MSGGGQPPDIAFKGLVLPAAAQVGSGSALPSSRATFSDACSLYPQGEIVAVALPQGAETGVSFLPPNPTVLVATTVIKPLSHIDVS